MMDFFFIFRIPHERKKENTKQEDQHLPHGLMLQETEDAQSTENQTKEIGEDTAAVEGPSLNKIELQKITNGKGSPGYHPSPSALPGILCVYETGPWSWSLPRQEWS
jgi:hypothetical protein